MKRKSTMQLVTLALIMVIFLISCQAHSPGVIMKLGEQDSGSTIEMEVGNTLEIALNANPSTGYVWEVASINNHILTQVGKAEFKSDRKARGSGGTLTMRFKAVSTGQISLKLVHHRPFEKDVPPIRAFDINVSVK